jgi:hypothetical protein
MLWWLFLAFVAILVAEISGHLVHAFLHLPPSWFDKRAITRPFRFVSVSHIAHHALAYGPHMLQRPSRLYFFVRNPDGGELQMKYGFLLLEFTIPSIPVLGAYLGGMWLAGLGLWEVLFCLGVTGAYVAFAFLYMHDTYHKAEHWLGRVPLFGRLWKKMRLAHDLHHMVYENGKLPYNLGIILPVVDMVRGTWITNYKNLTVEEETGELLSTPYTEEDYDAFYAQYALERPDAFDRADATIKHLLSEYPD